MRLIALKIGHDCWGLLDLLALLLNPSSRFMNMNSSRLSETFPTVIIPPGRPFGMFPAVSSSDLNKTTNELKSEEDVIPEDVHARCFETRSPRGFLVDYLNVFGRHAGFTALKARIVDASPETKPLTIALLVALLKPFGGCADYLTKRTVERYFQDVFVSFFYDSSFFVISGRILFYWRWFMELRRATTLCYFPVTFGFFCVPLNQSINQSRYIQLKTSTATTLCCFPVTSRFLCVPLNQSINQSRYIQLKTPTATTLCCFPVTFGFFCVPLNQSINQSRYIKLKTPTATTLCSFPVTSRFLCVPLNQSINQSRYIQLKTPTATTLCCFPVTSRFLCVPLNQSINQSRYIRLKTPTATTLCCFPVTSRFLCVPLNQSINQSRYIRLKTSTATTLCCFPVTFGFCVLLNQSINQSIKSYSWFQHFSGLFFLKKRCARAKTSM